MLTLMWTKIVDCVECVYYTLVLYVNAIFRLISPGTLIWNFFGERKGKVHLYGRDLICDSETLIREGKSFQPLDETTNALDPFLPLFSLNEIHQWKKRREVFSFGHQRILQRLEEIPFDYQLKSVQGDVLWSIFEIVFRYSFQLIFERKISEEEFQRIYPGLVDINRILKRFSSKINRRERQMFYDEIHRLIRENADGFLFHQCDRFNEMNEIDQVSSVGEDFLTTMSVQCTDLICHLFILYADHSEEFHRNFLHCLNETLRLYPLTDLWIRKSREKTKRSWIASLTQLNRNGWIDPNEFVPSRWMEKSHPPLLSWGFDIRRCPAQELGTHLSQKIFQHWIDQSEQLWIIPAKNFHHERTFPYGCQLWIGYGEKPSSIIEQQWIFPNEFRMKVRRWFCEKVRMIDQSELN